MTLKDLFKNINNKQYDRPWDPKGGARGKGAYVGDPPRNFEEDCWAYAQSVGITNREAFNVMSHIAWDMGHSSGLSDVVYVLDDLIEIAKIYEGK